MRGCVGATVVILLLVREKSGRFGQTIKIVQRKAEESINSVVE